MRSKRSEYSANAIMMNEMMTTRIASPFTSLGWNRSDERPATGATNSAGDTYQTEQTGCLAIKMFRTAGEIKCKRGPESAESRKTGHTNHCVTLGPFVQEWS